MHRIVAVRALEPFRVRLRFSDRSEGIADLSDIFSQGGVFEPLRSAEEFAKVRLDRTWGSIVWPGDVDLDPDVLYARVHGLPTEQVRAQQESRSR